METIIGYVVIFGFGILFAALFLFRKNKEMLLPITEQAYPQLIMAIFIKKEQRKITEIILQLKTLKSPLQISDFHIELTNERHDRKAVDIKPIMGMTDETIDFQPAQSLRFSIPFREFETFLSNQPESYDRFRFVVVTSKNKKFKSYALALNTRWGLFKQDSGRYN
jgi:hypothetical protein